MTDDLRSRHVVRPEQLRHIVPPTPVPETADTEAVIGQEEALATIRMGLEFGGGDYGAVHYNVAVVGSPSTGRMAKTLRTVRDYAAGLEEPPPDVVCLHNFEQPRHPLVAAVPNGNGNLLGLLLNEFADDLLDNVPKALVMLRSMRAGTIQVHMQQVIAEVRKALPPSCRLFRESKKSGLSVGLVSFSDPNKVMGNEEFEAIEDDEIKKRLEAELKAGTTLLNEAQDELITWMDNRKKLDDQQEVDLVEAKCNEHLRGITEDAGDNPGLVAWLATAKAALKQTALASEMPDDEVKGRIRHLLSVNVLVDNLGAKNPPVVRCEVPRFPALFGKVGGEAVGEDKIRVDHTMIEAGDVLRANGGYLVIDAEDLLRWGGTHALYKLFEVMRTRKLAIEGLMSFLGAERLVDFRPQPVTVNMKVVLVCGRRLDMVMRHVLPEYDGLFRIVAEFDSRMGAEDAVAAYSLFVAQCCKKDGLPEFAPEAVAALVEEGHRRADDQKYASAEFGVLKDIVNEAAYWARKAGAEKVEEGHVERAIKERFRRRTLAIRRYQEFVARGHILLSLEGERVGCVNKLAVMGAHSDHSFGLPLRATARAFRGKKGVVLVQREIGTSGNSSNQAVAVVNGWLAGEFGRDKNLSLAVQICFEQNYGGVDGDSATVAEVIAVISAITELPVDQSLTVTGSMNQHGEVQPIGGANEKITGHYDLLKRKGLLGPCKGVVLPVTNLENLMLSKEIVAAHEARMYTVHAISNIDDALEIFLSRPAAEIRQLVKDKLAEAAAKGKEEAPREEGE